MGTLDDLLVVATVTRRYATRADIRLAIADLQGWHAGEEYTITAEEVAAVLHVWDRLVDARTAAEIAGEL